MAGRTPFDPHQADLFEGRNPLTARRDGPLSSPMRGAVSTRSVMIATPRQRARHFGAKVTAKRIRPSRAAAGSQMRRVIVKARVVRMGPTARKALLTHVRSPVFNWRPSSVLLLKSSMGTERRSRARAAPSRTGARHAHERRGCGAALSVRERPGVAEPWLHASCSRCKPNRGLVRFQRSAVGRLPRDGGALASRRRAMATGSRRPRVGP